MSFQKSTRALKNEVLEICGELTDGTSPFESVTVKYLNKVYQGLLAGGNEFDIEVSEPWVWAQAKRPMLLSLQPSFTSSISLTKGSLNGVITNPPSYSLEGYYLRVNNGSDVYRIASHTAFSPSIHLDQSYLKTGGVFNFTAYAFEYPLFDDVIVINESNKWIDYREGAGEKSVEISSQAFFVSDLAGAIQQQLNEAWPDYPNTLPYVVSFDGLTRKFSIATDGTSLDLLFETGSHAAQSISGAIGFDIVDYKDSTKYTSTYANSGIVRLTKPMKVSRNSSDQGLIYMVDDNTFEREQSGISMGQVPDKFCISQQSSSGLWRVKFNSGAVSEPVRCEVNYIPVARRLTDNDISFPLVPGSFADYLVYGAANFILLDKSDNKADTFRGIAQAKLRAMVNDNRKNASLAGTDYGKLLPRGGTRFRRWW